MLLAVCFNVEAVAVIALVLHEAATSDGFPFVGADEGNEGEQCDEGGESWAHESSAKARRAKPAAILVPSIASFLTNFRQLRPTPANSADFSKRPRSQYSCGLKRETPPKKKSDPNGIRTRVTAVKGRCPNRWTIGSGSGAAYPR